MGVRVPSFALLPAQSLRLTAVARVRSASTSEGGSSERKHHQEKEVHRSAKREGGPHPAECFTMKTELVDVSRARKPSRSSPATSSTRDQTDREGLTKQDEDSRVPSGQRPPPGQAAFQERDSANVCRPHPARDEEALRKRGIERSIRQTQGRRVRKPAAQIHGSHRTGACVRHGDLSRFR